MSSRRLPTCVALAVLLGGAAPGASSQLDVRALRLRDLASLVQVEEPQAIAGSAEVVYEQRRIDVGSDSLVSSIWMAGAAHTSRRLVDAAAGPRPSPDGTLLAFRRDGQVWMLSLRGGDPWPLGSLAEPVEEVAWSPDGAQLVVVSRDPRAAAPMAWPDDQPSALALLPEHAPEDDADFVWVPAGPPVPATEALAAPAIAWPIEPDVAPSDPGRPLPRVLRRFELDGLVVSPPGPRHRHLWTLRVSRPGEPAATPIRLTRGPWDDTHPLWSPDGTHVVFSSDRRAMADDCGCRTLWAVPAAGGEPRRLFDEPGAAQAAAWSPDGAWLAYVHVAAPAVGAASPSLRLRSMASGMTPGAVVDLTAGLDRSFASPPRWAPDMSSLYLTIEDRGSVPLVRVSTGIPVPTAPRARRRGSPEPAGRLQAVVAGPRVVHSFALIGDGTAAALVISDATQPAEIYATPLTPMPDVEMPMQSPTGHLQGRARPVAAELRRLTVANVAWREQLQLAVPEPLRYASDADAVIEGWLFRPPTATAASALPLVVVLHSRPAAPATWAFAWELQWLAAHGYAVMVVNPRRAADLFWRDLVAGIDHLVDRGIADRARIGVSSRFGDVAAIAELAGQGDRLAAVVATTATGADAPAAALAPARVPTMLLSGGHDLPMVDALGMQVYASLLAPAREGGAEMALIVYPEAGEPWRPSLVADQWLRTKAWFDRHLLGDTDADPFFGEWSR